ncbi:MAG: hypothetical protein PHQ40_18380, partial [Anaerolineaceae bacterium]|nr:hypothetical protein [Anaerolineaceae bacterium]
MNSAIPAVNTAFNVRVEALTMEGHWAAVNSTPKTITCIDNWAGNHDGYSGSQSYSNCYGGGWANDSDNTSYRVQVRAMTDYGHAGQYTTQLATATANAYRSDLTGVCSGGYCAYGMILGSTAPVINTPFNVRVEMQSIEGFWDVLGNSPKSITCQDNSVPAAPIYDSNSSGVPNGGYFSGQGLTFYWHGTNNVSGIDGYYV